jgi:hypothetical protein
MICREVFRLTKWNDRTGDQERNANPRPSSLIRLAVISEDCVPFFREFTLANSTKARVPICMPVVPVCPSVV